MHKTFFALAVVLLAQVTQATAQKAEVTAVVQKFVDAFNKADIEAALSTCADQVSIIDEFPPYEWHGAGACGTWANAYDADAKKNGITDPKVTLGTFKHVDITGDRAYVVVPANYEFKQNGKPVKEIGSTLSITLTKGAAGWKMTAWSWAKN